MSLKVSPYKKKNGDVMLYVNDYSKKVSVGISDRVYSTKLTKAQKNVLGEFFEKLNDSAPIIKDFHEVESHSEQKFVLDLGITIYITDRANVAGNAVGADGLYLEKAGKLYSAAELNEVL